MSTQFSNIRYIENIKAEPKKDMILLRLGYKKNVTVLSQQDKDKVDAAIKEGMLLCQPKGAYGRFGIVERQATFVRLDSNVVLESRSLSEMLRYSEEVVLMASTVGSEITGRIADEIKDGDVVQGIIFDSVASQTADAGLDWMMDFINKMLRREGRSLTKHRYSPGYGDLALSNQKMIFNLLNLKKLGLDITERYMLVPEKSVIAIAGIERIEVNE